MGAHRRQPDYVMTVNDVTTSRDLDVTYTNTTGKTMFCIVTAAFESPFINSIAVANFQSPITYTIAQAGYSNYGIETRKLFPLTAVVKPGNTYRYLKYTENNGTVFITKWIETY